MEMNNSGITSQYGFLFQRKVFILYILENISAKQKFCFEGKDDVEIAVDDRIYALYDTPSNCVQVKSGTVSIACFDKVLGNWLLLDDSLERDTFTLFVENELDFEWMEDSLISAEIDFIKSGKEKKKTSIARKIFDRYKEDIESNESEKLIEDIKTILAKIHIDKASIEEMDARLERVFFDHHCQDISEYEMAKKKRLEKFLQYINQEIDDSIKAKKTYTLIFSELMKILTKVFEEISDHKYIANITYLKKSFKDKAKQIVNERTEREVRQLFLVDDKESFVIEGIVHELFYKDFRDIFIDKKNIEILNLEECAKINYDDVIFEADGELSPKRLYIETTSKTIENDILPTGPMYRKGCYIYLTGETVDENKKITWGEEDGA